MSKSSNHLRLVSWTWQWVHFTQMTSTVTRSQSNRAPLGCGGTRDSHRGCAADKSAATVWCYHDNMTKISEQCFQHLVESMPRRIKTVLKEKGVQPGTSKVYLIKWPVSVHIYIYVCVCVCVCVCIFWKYYNMQFSISGNLIFFLRIFIYWKTRQNTDQRTLFCTIELHCMW